jgi:pimeloyl-ACP methyl ester carboxylesterase
MATIPENWNAGDKSAMVSIGTHRLYLSISGPDRKSGQPIVILMHGLGSTIDEWLAVKRHVVPFARWLSYDRSGSGQSQSYPENLESISAVQVATELDTLLKNAGVEGPFIVVCHSWGGITAREFFHLRSEDIVGMVFVDANTEKTCKILLGDGEEWPQPFIKKVTENVDYMTVTGLAASNALSSEETAAVMKHNEDPRQQATQAAEEQGYRGDSPVLAAKKHFEKQVLGNRPISVIRGNAPGDMQKLYEAGVAAGNGSEEDRSRFRDWIAGYLVEDVKNQEEILTLSTVTHYVTAHCGHNVQMVLPELIADEVQWVLDRVV